MLIDAIDDDGYLRESLDVIAQSLLPEIQCSADEVLYVLHQVQRLDPVGVGARDLGECLVLQLDNLPDDTPGRVLARRIAIDHIDRLPRIGLEGVASELHCALDQADQALALLRSLDPRPGAQPGTLPAHTSATPTCLHPHHQ